MPTILQVDEQAEGSFLVTVRPEGFAAADGTLLAGKTKDPAAATSVGTWKSVASSDGTGVVSTPRGVFLFATQGASKSAPFPLPDIVV